MDTNYRDIWERYASSWKAETVDDKRALFEGSLDPECVYTDPLTQARGWQPLLDYMVEFHKQVPGGHFVTKEFFTHHQRSVARWNMVTGDGTVIGEGISYGEYTDAGKLRTMTGFFDQPQQ